MNILVYTGPGTTPHSTKQAIETLRSHLSPHYAVIPVSSQLLHSEPWQNKTSMLVIPGGADSAIVKEFRERGIDRKIKDWVKRQGGRYLGLCSGGYYGSARCEFEVGDLAMEVSGPRELGFFPGVARGCAFKGFQYGNENGARAVSLRVNPELEGFENGSEVINYYNGGAVFVDAEKFSDSVEVLAEYSLPIDVEYGAVSPAAVVYCQVGEGCAVLAGTHPEFVPQLLSQNDSGLEFSELVDTLKETDSGREQFMKAILLKMGLKVNQVAIAQPHLTPLFLSSPTPQVVSSIVHGITTYVGINERDGLVHGNKDNFSLSIVSSSSEINHLHQTEQGTFEDPATVTKKLYAFTEQSESLIPDRKMTPYFDIQAYFRALHSLYGSLTPYSNTSLIPGSALLYAEVITSTSMILNENINVLAQIPSGTLVTASIQISGRGRGGNPWVNPHGVLASSLVVDLPLNVKHAPVVFVQYLAALAVVEAVKSTPGYEELPIGIKWPNDVYCAKPEFFSKERNVNDSDSTHIKVCGILVNTNVVNNQYKLIVGTGINLDNEAPTTSINSTIKLLNEQRRSQGNLPSLPLLSSEELLAKYVHAFSKLYTTFLHQGFTPLLPTYYSHWFHTGQVVRLQDHGNTRVKIVGITDDWGLLEAVEVDMQNRVINCGQRFYLQPDGNSFDMFKGLISRKA